SDGRILVRFGPAIDDLIPQEGGLEAQMIPDCWTLVFPSIKDRDFLVRFNDDGTEEFRYEVLNVTRQRFFLDTEVAAQKFTAQRVRKYDPIQAVPVFRDSSTMPTKLTTSIGFLRGVGNSQIPHTHTVVISEKITVPSQINQITSTD